MEESIYQKYGKADLENIAALRKISTSGSKKVLINRLLEHDNLKIKGRK